jgi:hypothetical protein
MFSLTYALEKTADFGYARERAGPLGRARLQIVVSFANALGLWAAQGGRFTVKPANALGRWAAQGGRSRVRS